MQSGSAGCVIALSLSSALSSALAWGCTPVAVDFGQVAPPAVANIYLEKSGAVSVELGSYCADVQSVSQGEYTMTDTGGYQAVWVTGESQLVLRLVNGAQVVDEHLFDQTFLDSGKFERREFTLPNGDQLAYVVWGADSCEHCPPYAPGGSTCFPETHTKPGIVQPAVPGVVVDSPELGSPAPQPRPTQ